MVQPPRKTVYTNNKISEKERDKTITFTIASKQENIRDKFIEEMKVCTLKTIRLMKETEEVTNKWKDSPVLMNWEN